MLLALNVVTHKTGNSYLYINLHLMEHYSAYIAIDPNTRFGRPCLKSTRISVYDVLGWLASGMTRDEIIEDYPELSPEMIQACLAYAADREHRIRHAS